MTFFIRAVDLETANKRFVGGPDRFLGVVIEEINEDEHFVSASFEVSEKSVQPFGLLHGGVSCLVGESVASFAGNMTVEDGFSTVGQSLTANHLRSAQIGDKILATARNTYRGRRSQVWNVDLVRKKDQKLISQVILTLSVIEVRQ